MITKNSLNAMKIELTKSLIELSKGKIEKMLANNIATKIVDNIDLNNSAVMHKGIEWIAKETIESIDFNKLQTC